MKYTKEKEYLIASDDTGYCGKFSFATGEYFGKRKAVKNIPPCFTGNNLWEERKDPYVYALLEWRRNGQHNLDTLHTLEKIAALGFTITDCTLIDKLPPLKKPFIDFIRENYNNDININAIDEYLYRDFFTMFGNTYGDILRGCCKEGYPRDYVESIGRRCYNEGVFEFFDETLSYAYAAMHELICNYYNISMKLYNTVNVQPNILSAYGKLIQTYNVYKRQHLSEILRTKNDVPALYFELGDFRAFPLLTAEDFHAEAEAQHNCVERIYMERVANDKTHVVVIRDIHNIQKPLVTCEVSNTGRIIQYLGVYNQPVEDTRLIQFRQAYLVHLLQNM